MMARQIIEFLEVRHLLANFLPDLSFGQNGYAAFLQGADLTLVQSDNRVIVLDNESLDRDVEVTRLQYNGQFDPQFADDVEGLPAKTTVCAGTTMADDRYLVAFYRGDVTNVATVMRFLPSGERDGSFGHDGQADITFPNPSGATIAHVKIENIAVNARGVYVLATLDARPTSGAYTKVASLARLTSAGAVDKAFGTSGFRTMGTSVSSISPEARLASTPASQVYVLAYESKSPILWRLDSTGKPDKTWNGTGQTPVPFVSNVEQPALDVQSNGLPILGAPYGDHSALWRLSSTGAIDSNFGDGGRADLPLNPATGDVDVAPTVQTLHVMDDDRIMAIVGGVVFRRSANGDADTTFDTDGQAPIPYTFVHSIDHLGRVIINGNQRFSERGLATLANDGTLYVTGLDSSDSISIRDVGTRVRISASTGSYDFNFGKARRINVDLKDSDDLFTSSTILPITINGGRGNDTIICASTQDTIYGGDGDDSIVTGDGNDVIFLDQGNDTVTSAAGDDLIVDGFADASGNDNDSVDAGEGNDTIKLAYGNNTIWGGDGDDVIKTGDGNNWIAAGLGRDYVRSGAGDDTLDGSGGNDNLLGGAGDDLLMGGSGNDILLGGPGRDTLVGNAGNDQIYAADPADSDPDAADGGSGIDTMYGDSNDLATSIEQILRSALPAKQPAHRA